MEVHGTQVSGPVSQMSFVPEGRQDVEFGAGFDMTRLNGCGFVNWAVSGDIAIARGCLLLLPKMFLYRFLPIDVFFFASCSCSGCHEFDSEPSLYLQVGVMGCQDPKPKVPR